MTVADMIYTLEDIGISAEVIDFAIHTYGANFKTMKDILYWKTGYRSFEDYLEDEDDGEPDYDLDEGFDPYLGDYTWDC